MVREGEERKTYTKTKGMGGRRVLTLVKVSPCVSCDVRLIGTYVGVLQSDGLGERGC